MEGRLLLWLYGVSAVYGAAVLVRRRGAVGQRYILALLAIAAVCAAGLLVPAAETAAVVAGTAGFAVVLLLPGALVRRARRAAGRGRFRAAWRLGRAAAVLLGARAVAAEAALYREVAAAGPTHPAAEEIRRRFGGPRGRPALLRHPAGAILAAAMLAAYAAVSLSGGSGSALTLLAWGANCGPLTLSGEPWRLLSATFLHAGPLHLLLNATGVLMLAAWLAPPLGGVRVAAVFLLTGAAGNLASALFYREAGVLSVGASGGAMGLIGAGIVVFLRLRDDPGARPRVSALLFVALATVGLGLVEPQIDNGAHLAGLLAGMAAGAALVRFPRAPEVLPRAVCAALALLTALSFAFAAGDRDRWLGAETFTAPDFEFPRPRFLTPRTVSTEWVFAGPPVGSLVVEVGPDAGEERLARRLEAFRRIAESPGGRPAIRGPADWPGRPGVRTGAVEWTAERGPQRVAAYLVPSPGGDCAALLTFEYSPPDEAFEERVVRPVVLGFRLR